MLFGILRNLSIMRILLFLGLWFFVISPFLTMSYQRVVACYTWMLP